MIAETVKIRNATIRVHDDSYLHRTEKEVQDQIVRFRGVIADALLRQRKQKNAENGAGGQVNGGAK